VNRRPDRSFVVPVGALRRAPGSRRRVQVESELEGLSVSGSHVPEGQPVRLEAVLEAVHDGILVSGTVTTLWAGGCRRCLEEARGELRVEVRELCVEDGDEETTYALGPEELDLAPIAHDACILDLPLAPLCSEECLGLCPECGANRNLERCACVPSPDPRWAQLVLLPGGEPDDPQHRQGRGPGAGG